MTADDKYSLLNRENLTQQILTQLSQKQKSFSEFFLKVPKFALNLEHFQKKISLIADFFPKLRTPENVARYMSNKSRLKGPFDRRHGKRVQTVLRSGQKHFYHIY